MDKFIKVSLTGQDWGQSEIGKQRDYGRFTNLIADYVRTLTPLDGTPADSRTVSISVCDQVDRIHFIESDQPLIIKI